MKIFRNAAAAALMERGSISPFALYHTSPEVGIPHSMFKMVKTESSATAAIFKPTYEQISHTVSNTARPSAEGIGLLLISLAKAERDSLLKAKHILTTASFGVGAHEFDA